MNSKEYLSQVLHIEQRIQSKMLQVQRLREALTHCTQTMTDMPRSAPIYADRNAETIAQLLDMETLLKIDLARLLTLQKEVREHINRLKNPDQQLILELRYLCGKTWPEIQSEMGYSRRSVFRIHGVALDNLKIPERLLGKSIEEALAGTDQSA